LEEKWEEVKRCFSFTFHWPPSLGSTFTPFYFSLKGELGSLGGFLSPDIIFNSVLNICFEKLLEEEKND
jgi:hypothetical protein